MNYRDRMQPPHFIDIRPAGKYIYKTLSTKYTQTTQIQSGTVFLIDINHIAYCITESFIYIIKQRVLIDIKSKGNVYDRSYTAAMLDYIITMYLNENYGDLNERNVETK